MSLLNFYREGSMFSFQRLIEAVILSSAKAAISLLSKFDHVDISNRTVVLDGLTSGEVGAGEAERPAVAATLASRRGFSSGRRRWRSTLSLVRTYRQSSGSSACRRDASTSTTGRCSAK